jgi:hypothetical protein
LDVSEVKRELIETALPDLAVLLETLALIGRTRSSWRKLGARFAKRAQAAGHSRVPAA